MAAVTDGDVRAFLDEGGKFFNSSKTAMHSIDRERLVELQRAALARRFAQHSQSIPMVAKLAGRQEITGMSELTDVVPLLFEHSMYKSYPVALLERQQFHKLTGSWLQKLTPVDLSRADVAQCQSIDEWLGALDRTCGLEVAYSSGTSGVMSFTPFSRRDYQVGWWINRINTLQKFGEPPTEAALQTPFHYALRINRLQGNDRSSQFTLGADATHNHTCFPRPSADLAWLGAQLRYAAARGDASRVHVPTALLARRHELESVKSGEQAAVREWLAGISELQGGHLFWTTFPHDVFEVADEMVARGERWSFLPGSVMLLGGGTKGKQLPPDWRETVEQATGMRTVAAYAMSELTTMQVECAAGNYHLNPWLIPFVFEPETSEMLPRSGVQTGRFGYHDLLAESHWGGVLTGDEVTVHFDEACACGASTLYAAAEVSRLSDKRGGDDKITCSTSPQAYDEVMKFLSSY